MIKEKSTISDNSELISLYEEIKNIEIRKNQIVSSIMNDMQKTVKEWSKDISFAHFNESITNLFAETFNQREGTDYFAWTSNEEIQKDFEIFVKKILKNKEKLFLNKYDSRFFTLKKFNMKSTSRSSIEFDYCSINDKGQLVYKYCGTSYHGFGHVDNTVQQEMIIDVEKKNVDYYLDSTKQHHAHDIGCIKLKDSFIKKLIK